MMPALTSQETKQLLAFQTNEITEHHIYHQLSLLQKNENNRRILTELAAEESGHYQLLKTYTQKEVGPKRQSSFLCLDCPFIRAYFQYQTDGK